MYPEVRLRRTRDKKKMREMVRETSLTPGDFVYPLFVDEKLKKPVESCSMPGVVIHTIDSVPEAAGEARDSGIPAILLFGIPAKKDECGSGSYSKEGIVQRATRAIKDVLDMVVITDLCLCNYTTHGHCGIFDGGKVLNDETLELYGKIAVSQAEAEADIIAPSGMMDGMVKTIREALDESRFKDVLIMSYSIKYCSSFYEPFREVMGSDPSFMGRESYQMDFGNRREAIREVALDVEEGADIIMIKPALPYLDVIKEVRDRFDLPLAAYQVSGEYAMLKGGALNYGKALIETLTSIKRAGSDIIVTYGALDASRALE